MRERLLRSALKDSQALLEWIETTIKTYERVGKLVRRAMTQLMPLEHRRMKPEAEFKRLGKAEAFLEQAIELLEKTRNLDPKQQAELILRAVKILRYGEVSEA